MSGIVSGFYYRNFQVLLKQKGWKEKNLLNMRSRGRTILFKQLLHYAVNEKIITLSRRAELANMSLSEIQENVRAAI